MEKHKDLENIRIERDSLQATLKETDANYQGLKLEKDILSINKLHDHYKNMEETLLKHQNEVEELKVDNANKGKLTKGMHRWTEICRSKWPLMKS